jgi:hypothetical protein
VKTQKTADRRRKQGEQQREQMLAAERPTKNRPRKAMEEQPNNRQKTAA